MVLQGSMIDIVSERSMNILARSLLVSNAGVITLLHSISCLYRTPCPKTHLPLGYNPMFISISLVIVGNNKNQETVAN